MPTENPSGRASLPFRNDDTMRQTVHADRPSFSPISSSVMSPDATISTSLALRMGISDLGSLVGETTRSYRRASRSSRVSMRNDSARVSLEISYPPTESIDLDESSSSFAGSGSRSLAFNASAMSRAASTPWSMYAAFWYAKRAEFLLPPKSMPFISASSSTRRIVALKNGAYLAASSAIGLGLAFAMALASRASLVASLSMTSISPRETFSPVPTPATGRQNMSAPAAPFGEPGTLTRCATDCTALSTRVPNASSTASYASSNADVTSCRYAHGLPPWCTGSFRM